MNVPVEMQDDSYLCAPTRIRTRPERAGEG